MRVLTILTLLVCLAWRLPVWAAYVPDEDDQGPGLFYFAQYSQQPWRDPNSPRELFRKSEKLLAGIILVSGWLLVKKRQI